MRIQKMFSLEEARELIPTLREIIQDANDEMLQLQVFIQSANKKYTAAEELMSEESADTVRQARLEFEQAVAEISDAQSTYIERLNFWVEKISSYGVILRDLREGLLDFPAQKDDFPYLLCWRMDDDDLNFWHTTEEGYVGRKPLVVLDEYF